MKQLLQFLKSYNFRKGLILTTSAFLAVIIGSLYFNQTAGIGIAFGILLAAPGDVQGSTKHHIFGILAATLLAATATSVLHLSHFSYYALVPTLFLFVFISSIISVYGFRAAMVSFSGLLAIALSFAQLKSGIDILYTAMYIIIGGLWYLGVTLFVSKVLVAKQIGEELLIETMQLTADYLETRGELALAKDRKPLLEKLFSLQTSINEKHETLRSIVLNTRKNSLSSGYQRRQLLIFVELVDMLELAIANPINYESIDEQFKDHLYTIASYQNLLFASAEKIRNLSYKLTSSKIHYKSRNLNKLLKKINDTVEEYKQKVFIPNRRENVLLLRHLYDYEEKQIQKIDIIERIVLDEFDGLDVQVEEDRQRFITSQDYSWKTLRDNLNFNSVIFKHSLRLSIAAIISLGVGIVFDIHNAYWILLTLFVIMRPNYGLTKQRSLQRVAGTFIGGMVSLGIIYFTTSSIAYAVITYFAMILAFAFIQQNYRMAAFFITINIVFVYALITDNTFEIVLYRVIDTAIGAALATLANYIIFPNWEAKNIKNVMQSSLTANLNYLNQIIAIYVEKPNKLTLYKLSRKSAFIEMGNLHAAFQRMAQEPKSKQLFMSNVYQIVVLHHAFLSNAAALGTYITNHKTTKASDNFIDYTNAIQKKLNNCIVLLKDENKEQVQETNVNDAVQYFNTTYQNLVAQREAEIAAGQLEISKPLQANLKEALLVNNQLQYLYNLSDSLEKAIQKQLQSPA